MTLLEFLKNVNSQIKDVNISDLNYRKEYQNSSLPDLYYRYNFIIKFMNIVMMDINVPSEWYYYGFFDNIPDYDHRIEIIVEDVLGFTKILLIKIDDKVYDIKDITSIESSDPAIIALTHDRLLASEINYEPELRIKK